MLLLIALTVAGGGLTPTPEAESFGVRLARTGMLATLLPMMVATLPSLLQSRRR